MKTLFNALAATALVAAATPALAGDDRPRATVEYKDLDLSTEKGQATLNRRVEAAAQQVCGSDTITGSRIPRGDSCIADAVKSVQSALAAKGINATLATR